MSERGHGNRGVELHEWNGGWGGKDQDCQFSCIELETQAIESDFTPLTPHMPLLTLALHSWLPPIEIV